jgi:translation initiation factor 1
MSGLFAGTKWERPITCERCAKPLVECLCPRDAAGNVCLPKDQPARVLRERRGGGKMVTVVAGLDAKATDLAGLLKRFKAELGTGGTVADGRIEIQGDHREKMLAALRELGYPAKASGG